MMLTQRNLNYLFDVDVDVEVNVVRSVRQSCGRRGSTFHRRA